jgi:hypothetical protein
MYGHNLQRKRRRGPAGSFGKVYDMGLIPPGRERW